MNDAVIPQKPRKSSTVILFREHRDDLQVYLLKRSGKSRFFPHLYVFPGGTVDSGDTSSEFWEPRIDIGLQELALRFGSAMENHDALGFYISAIRETFEEAGILLAGGRHTKDDHFKEICELRSRQDLKETWFQDAVSEWGCSLAVSDLVPWSHWITPEAMKYRYDTMFFLALMPDEQACSPDFFEMTDGLWVTPIAGLEGNSKGAIPLSPPTVVTLQQLVSCHSLDDVLGEAKQDRLNLIMPRFVPFGRDGVILEPWDSLWDSEDNPHDPREVEPDLLPPGEPFSRLWLHDGLYRPIQAKEAV